MSKNEQLYNVWWDHAAEEENMEAQHIDGWKEIVSYMKEEDLSPYSVLDFGCNRGGFLRYLYSVKPFKAGVGIDRGVESVKIANERKRDLPLTYVATGSPEQLEQKFDLGFALSVIYLIDDLKTHARKIKQVLKPGGVYYVTYTDLSNNPSADHFQKTIEQYSHLKANVHTLDDIASAFTHEGFHVQLMRKRPRSFIDISGESEYFQSVQDQVKAQYEQAYVFRFSLPDA
ncbi:class I SAM-dependent methyltransferase [Alkalihalobacillus oceani]|uniref:class I SAM-dependent methyltransferase n=1 Tax=Halalkalibacter oceani TaxID=1653776 RepID=UPI002040714A|nr:class I SAM-dependent methyltransferase [Halalkalibacter oceani]MCM3760578.1 class I SAM-dependent methyltransferase [Halalkalibacter oceani]